MCGNDNDRVRVVVDLERYEQMVRAEEHYTNIVHSAIDNVSLSAWRSDGFDIDMDDIKEYIKVVESDALSYKKKRLEAKKLAEDESVTVTVKGDEI